MVQVLHQSTKPRLLTHNFYFCAKIVFIKRRVIPSPVMIYLLLINSNCNAILICNSVTLSESKRIWQLMF